MDLFRAKKIIISGRDESKRLELFAELFYAWWDGTKGAPHPAFHYRLGTVPLTAHATLAKLRGPSG